MCDDFNTARAVAHLHDLTTEVNRVLDENPSVSPEDAQGLKSSIGIVSEVFGILEEDPGRFLEQVKRAGIGEIGIGKEEIEDLISQRVAARKAKDFKKADEIRNMLLSKGIQLKDSPEGTTWEKV